MTIHHPSYGPAEGTPEYKLIQSNKAALRQIRGSLSFLSDEVRLNVARWCIESERDIEQPGLLPWESLERILGENINDQGILQNNCSAFKEYCEKKRQHLMVTLETANDEEDSFSSPPPPIVHRSSGVRESVKKAYSAGGAAAEDILTARRSTKPPSRKVRKEGK